MPPKKGKGKKGKKGKKGAGALTDPDDYKSLNVQQRQILIGLFDKMKKNREANDFARKDLHETLEDLRQLGVKYVSLKGLCSFLPDI